VVIGAVIGIGLYKGVRNINMKVLGGIASGWITTPVIAGLITFFLLFFVRNLFGIDIGYATNPAKSTGTGMNFSIVIKYIILGLLIVTSIYLIYLLRTEKKKTDMMNKKYYE
jgi:phosphate/sulfate permease